MKWIKLTDQRGFTMIEMIVVLLIAAVLVAVGMQTASRIIESAKVESTMHEMDQIIFAIAGNPALRNGGIRADFGYVGDVGSFPPNLDALVTNPGGFTTWKGPYIANQFTQVTDDFKKDSWGTAYVYYQDSNLIRSTGSGSTMQRKIVETKNDALYNSCSGLVTDWSGTPPGTVYKDSITIRLTIPNGLGASTTKTKKPDLGGYFALDSIPIGNHSLQIIYSPANDTIKRTISVDPGSTLYSEFHLAGEYW